MNMLAATIILTQLHCAPSPSGSVDCWDAAKGGAPVLKVEPNLLGGFDLRQSDGKLVRCENRNRCARCGETLYPFRLNANY